MAIENREEFAEQVAEKLGELTGEKPTVSEQELADALGLGDGSLEPDRLMDTLDTLATASVAVQVGSNAESGRMWRHSGLDDDEARRLLAAQHALDRREAEAAARVEDDDRPDDDLPDASARHDDEDAPRRAPAAGPRAGVGKQRIELPMAVASTMSEDAIGALVAAGVKAADDANAPGFEFVVTVGADG